MTPNSRYLTAKQAADMLHIGRSTLYSYIKQGLITPIKVGRRFLFHPDELHKQLEGSTSETKLRQAEVLSKFRTSMVAKNVEVSPELMIVVESLLEIMMPQSTAG